MKLLSGKLLIGAVALALVAIPARSALADTVSFAPGDYDNTKNEVTAGPVYTNYQTTGQFRDVFWWRDQATGAPFIPSADYINSGKNLVSCGVAACDNGTGAFTALNFTGPDQAPEFGVTYLTLYDTDANGTGENNFDASVPGGVTISADVLFAKNHATSAGVVMMYDEGQDGLALLANNGGGTGDHATLDLVWQSPYDPIVLASVQTNPTQSLLVNNWYRVTLTVTVDALGNFVAVGTIKSHVDGADPNSGFLATLATLNLSRSLADPDSGINALKLTNPGEVGLMALGRETIGGPGCAPSTAGGTYNNTLPLGGTNTCTDNMSVSITNFSVPTTVPEPASLMLLGTGLLGLTRLRRRKH